MEEWFGGRSRDAVASSIAPGLWRLVAEASCAAAGYALIAVVLLHPWFSDPGRSVASLSPGGGGIEVADVNLVMWILSWDWHALTTNPLGLFDANIFHPAPNALAASEHLLGQVAMFGPMYAWSGNPVLAYQFNFLANLALSGAGLYALVRHWGVSPTGAFFGGLIYAFLPFRLHTANYPHLFAGQYAPIALLFLDRTLLRARAWDAVAFCLALLMQMLCSYYLAYITSVALAAYVAGVCWAGRRHIVVRGALLAMAGAGVAVAIFAFFSIPYMRLRSAGAIPDATELHWLRIFSARPWWAFLKPGSHFYLGFIPFLLALAGLARSPLMAPRVPWVRASAVFVAVGCILMALGPELPLGAWTIPLPYQAAMDFVPGFSSMRAPRRFVLMAALGFAALAGIGLSFVVLHARRRFGRAVAIAIALVVFVGTAVEFGMLTTPHRVRRVRSGGVAPEVYRVLATVPRGPVLEIPSNRFDGHFRGALDVSEYMFYSTVHWNSLIDGYSGYVPPSAYVTRALVSALPSEKALSLLRRTTGLRYVIVHKNRLSPAAVREWENPPGLRPLRALSFGAAVLFEVIDPAEPDLVSDLIRLEPRSTTMLGLPLAPLRDDDMRAAIHVRAQELGVLSFYPVPIDVLVERDATVISGFPITVDVTITNESNAAWPSLATVGDHLVTVGYRWEAMDGSVLAEDQLASRLAFDLAPGESVRQRLAVFAPTAGEARLVVGLVQGGLWFPSAAEPIQFTVQSGSALEVFLPGRGTVPTDA